MAERYIKIDGTLVAVTEEVYYTYYHMERQCRTQEEKLMRRRVASYDALDTEDGLGVDLIVDEDSPSVEDCAITNVMVEKLYRCLDLLSEDDRALLISIYFHEKSERKIAKSLGISQKAVNKRRHKALINLKDFMEKDLGSQPPRELGLESEEGTSSHQHLENSKSDPEHVPDSGPEGPSD